MKILFVMEKCYLCSGKGYVDITQYDYLGIPTPCKRKCYDCNGTGIIEYEVKCIDYVEVD